MAPSKKVDGLRSGPTNPSISNVPSAVRLHWITLVTKASVVLVSDAYMAAEMPGVPLRFDDKDLIISLV